MKTLRYLILGLIMTATVGRAQISSPGWFRVQKQASPPQARSNFAAPSAQFQSQGQFMPLFQPIGIPATPVAETITPQIQALADGLQDNPELIFNWVHDHIKFVLYFGSKKGANLTLLEKSGNDFDQSALLVAMLHAAGYANAQYQFGWQEIPYDDPYGDDYDLKHWWQLTLNNTNWTNTINYVFDLALNERGYPDMYYFNDGNTFDIQRTWVSVTVGSRTYQLDPAFKISEPVTTLSGFSLTNAMGGSATTISNALLTAAGGTDTGNYAQSLSEANLRGKLTSYTTNLFNYIQSNSPNASVQDVLGGWQITPAYDPWDYVTYTLFPVDTFGGQMPILTWANEPTNIMSTLKITFAGTNYQWFMPQLQGQRLALTFDNSGTAQLWQDDTLLAQHATSGGGSTNVILFAHHPFGIWDETNNVFIDGNYADQISTNSYQRTNSTYALLYAFEPDWGWLQQRENKLDTYLQQGLTNGSRQVTSETLNIMGLNWMLQTESAGQMLASQLGMSLMDYHRLGRMAQETGHGYYVDVYMQLTAEYPNGGDDPAHIQISNAQFDLWSFFASSMEHGIIEQLQNTNLVGASTVKMLQIANTNGQAVYLASSTNWTTGYNVKSHLTANTYDSGTLTTIGNYISQGYYVLLPANGSNHVSSASGSWAGYGYEARQAVSGVASESEMIISGSYHGGYSSDPTIPIDPIYVDTSGDYQFDYYDNTPVYTPPTLGGDPMDLANGTFQVESTDLSVGQAEPRGISLSRYYNGTRRFSNVGGMTGGWIHNYCVTASQVAAPQAVLGGTTPAQAASMFTATAAAIATYNGGYPNPKNWLTTALIAKWGVDQLTKSGVSVNLGKNTLQFVQQPNGVFTPPGSSTATLTQNSGAYTLQMRHGNKFTFNTSGLLASIADQYGQTLNLTYNASNWVSTVKDWQNHHTFTFNYSGTPSRLTSVSDGTRTVSYGYSTAYNSQGDLTSFTDPESKVSTYQYDTNHQITATLDAQSRLVVSNLYDSQGHVTTQYTQGDTNKTWHICWSGWRTMLFDPANDWTDYYYDDQGRLIAVVDPLNYETDTYYDGQNHITYTVSPQNEVNQLVYDGNNNLIQRIDPLGFTNQFVYDNQNNLTKRIDPRGNISTFGYNTQFSLTGQTNGAGDFVNYSYTTSGALAGTLASKTDSGGITTFGYDSNGQLNSIVYPNSLGTNSFVNNSFGDVTSRTDGRGFVTTFSYNYRRQLTNSVAPTNLVSKAAFDAVGNMASTTDQRGNVSSFSWSATHNLLATTLPATQQGTPVVTNFYDSRDWLIKTLDPYQQPTLYTNDADGRLTSQTDPLLRTTTFGYDGDGRKTSIRNAASETIQQQWDNRGSLVKFTDGAGHTIFRSYDQTGNQIALTNRNGNVWQFQFDGANRLTNTISPLSHSTSVAFNHQGLPASVRDPKGQTTTNTFDGKGRLISCADNMGTTLYNFDANDNRTGVAGNGLTNSWTYDAYNHVSSYKDVYGNLIQYKYDLSGNLTNLVYPGGKNVYYTFDSNNHLTQVKDWSGRITTLAYDLAGKLTSITRPNGTYRTIGYDVTGQATNILEQNAIGFPIALFRFNWNKAAEIQWEFAAPLPHTNSLPTRTMTYDADNRLAMVDGNGVTVDADGNLVSGPLTNDTFAAYTYDTRNRLLNASGVTNVYDAMNNRIGQIYGTNSTAFVVNPNAKLPQILMRIKNGITNYYIYGGSLLYQITETATATNTLTYHYDCRGSTVALTDDNGNVTDRMEYSAYATLTYRAGTSDTPFLFNGAYGVMTDPNGLLYMNARYYSPFICRFLNPDPTGFSGGLNFYAYANGNPISLLDPFGLSAWVSSMGALRAIGGGLEAMVGYTFAVASGTAAVASSETVVGAVGFGALAVGGAAAGAHGADTFQAGIRQFWTGNQVTSLTSQDLQAAGMSQNAANLTDAGIGVVGSLGAGLATAPIRLSTIAATDPLAAGLSSSEILDMWETGSQALNRADWQALGGTVAPDAALYRAMLIENGVDMSGNAYQLTTTSLEEFGTSIYLAPTGLTPLAAAPAGYLGAGLDATTGLIDWLGTPVQSSITGKPH